MCALLAPVVAMSAEMTRADVEALLNPLPQGLTSARTESAQLFGMVNEGKVKRGKLETMIQAGGDKRDEIETMIQTQADTIENVKVALISKISEIADKVKLQTGCTPRILELENKIKEQE